jgi:hypothetical protein
MIRWPKEMLLFNILLVPPIVFFPAICLTPAAHPHPLAAQLCFWFGHLSAGFWVLVYSQWCSAMAWQRVWRLHQWRSDHGGFAHTLPRACGSPLLGVVASFLAEVAFCLAFRRFAPGDERFWFQLFPLAALSPLLPRWLWRRRHA